ncbi:Response regulator receiver domain-containing protein [Dehalogenimonas formicexedens]|uniref:Response regulator receiver domain-containing protein n=1 Tax=Dehalogenimonas formicexedens TaxID=1839801 RepID=A0A1P8F9K9_9CHLR|nr:response regulator [Dehalogenimonas formicexedens]APV45122.1 Response regulator receiver domain-containing protein [Dehalogenimonas formicexedens]
MTEKASGFRILVVEDEYSISEICKRTLTADGFDVSLATDGHIALRLISEQDYDLILVDVKMPNMTGIEMHYRLTNENPEAARRVIFATGDVFGDTLDAVAASGCLCLSKPFSPAELRCKVKQALGLDSRIVEGQN